MIGEVAESKAGLPLDLSFFLSYKALTVHLLVLFRKPKKNARNRLQREEGCLL
jgi:hypothetical protein